MKILYAWKWQNGGWSAIIGTRLEDAYKEIARSEQGSQLKANLSTLVQGEQARKLCVEQESYYMGNID